MAQTGGAQDEPAEEPTGARLSAGVDLSSAFVWRGITLNDGLVAQPSLSLEGLSLGQVPLTFTLWSNFNRGSYHGSLKRDRCSEVDLSVTAELGGGFTAGFTQFFYPNQVLAEDEERWPGTGEVLLAWSGPWEVITPTVTLAYDVEEVDGAFLTLAASHSFSLNEKVTLALTGEVGAASDAFAEYYTGTEGGWYYYGTAAALSVQASDHFEFSVSAGYFNHFQESVLPDQEVDFVAGVSLAYSF